MKQITLLVILWFCTNVTFAQGTAKVYYSDRDYARDNYVTEDVYIKCNRHSSYDINARDRKKLNKTVWAVERNDSLWLNNCKVLAPNPDYVPRRSGIKYKPKGYELVLLRSHNYLCFRGPRANVNGMYGQRHVPDQSISAPSPVAIALNAAWIAAEIDYVNSQPVPRFNYVYDMPAREPVYLSRSAMEEYYHRATAREDTSFRKFLVRLAKAQ